jgi:hypothetical protein
VLQPTEGKSEESSFLQKRRKRLLFLRLRKDRGRGRMFGKRRTIKVFGFISSEKERFLISC